MHLLPSLLAGGTLAVAALPADAADPAPLPRAHAHNDYEHARPLLDALDHGFSSVEADVFLSGDSLLVAHEAGQLRPERTLQRLYLDPLRERVRARSGRVYEGSDQPFFLLIDLKTEGEPTYRALHGILAAYPDLFTRFRPAPARPGPVTVIISGNRPRQLMENQQERFAGFDGRIADLGSGASAEFMPWISDNWTNHFAWRGEGPCPETDRAKLRELVRATHAEGKRLRLWAAPDRPECWTVLDSAGVDLINTDDLKGLAEHWREAPSAKVDP